LSDYEVEDRINDSISFSKFCGLTLEQTSPYHSTLSRFRTQMTKVNAYEKLFKELNKQLDKHKIIVKTGAILDASVIDTPLKPKGKVTHQVTEDRDQETQNTQTQTTEKQAATSVKKEVPNSVDKEASWLKKARKLRYGYKKHYVTDEQGLVLGVVTTKVSINKITNLEEVLNAADLPQHIALKADKGYQSEKNNELLKAKKLKNHILKKAKKNKPLSE